MTSVHLLAHVTRFFNGIEHHRHGKKVRIPLEHIHRAGSERPALQLTGAHFSLHLLVVPLHATAVKFEFHPALGLLVDHLRAALHVVHPGGTFRRNGRNFEGLGKSQRTG